MWLRSSNHRWMSLGARSLSPHDSRAVTSGSTRWAASEVFDAYPDTEQVRVRFLRMTVRLPWEAPSPEEPPENARLFARPAYGGAVSAARKFMRGDYDLE